MSALISVGQVIDQSVHHFRKQFQALMSVSLFLFAGMPLLIVSSLVYSTDSFARVIVALVCQVLGLVITTVAGIWVFNALVLMVDGQAKNKKIGLENVQKLAWKKFFPAIGVSLLVSLLIVSTVLFFVPGYSLVFVMAQGTSILTYAVGAFLIFAGGVAAICTSAWLGVTYIFAPYGLLLEDLRIKASLTRAHTLVKGRWWATMVRVLIPKVTILIVLLFVQYLLTVVLSVLSASLGESSLQGFAILANLFKVGFSVIATPLFVIADYYVFRSLIDTAPRDAS